MSRSKLSRIRSSLSATTVALGSGDGELDPAMERWRIGRHSDRELPPRQTAQQAGVSARF